jgi:FkbM family methyltransferase
MIYRSPLASPLRRVLSASAPSGMRLIEVCGGANAGMRMSVDLASEKYYWLGTHEERAQEFVAGALRNGDVVWDIGAHAGFFSLLFARLAGHAGRVYAFEPVAENWSRLCDNIAANGLKNVDARCVAIGETIGETRFAAGRTSLQGRMAWADDAAESTVPVTTIDELVRGGCAPPDFIKIDVEGAEAAVLRGGADTIAKARPRMLIEVHSWDAGVEVGAILGASYAFVEIERGEEASPPLAPGHYDARPRS